MESYLVEVIDEDSESCVLLNFADTIQELVDNIVCMEQFVFIKRIKRVSDNKEIKLLKDVIDLEDLRMYRLQIELTSKTGSRGKKTHIGRGNVGYSTMPKRKKQTYKAYRGQGK
jgi:hypothetical protein